MMYGVSSIGERSVFVCLARFKIGLVRVPWIQLGPLSELEIGRKIFLGAPHRSKDFLLTYQQHDLINLLDGPVRGFLVYHSVSPLLIL